MNRDVCLSNMLTRRSCDSAQVSGAGTPGVNGVYEADTTGDFDKIGTAFSNGNYVLLFERAGKVLSKGSKIKRNRWLIFNDDEGVHGDRPYYELLGKYSSFDGQWRVVSGAGNEYIDPVSFSFFFFLALSFVF